MKPPYTRRQGQFLHYISTYIDLHRCSPSEADLVEHFRVSPPSVHQMVVTLTERGLITRIPGQGWSIRLAIPPEMLPGPDGVPRESPDADLFRDQYPYIAHWITSGRQVVLGAVSGRRSIAAAMDERGIVWEGKADYTSLGDLMADLEAGLARRLTNNR